MAQLAEDVTVSRIIGFIAFPASKDSVTLQFVDERHRTRFPWKLLLRQDLLRQFVLLLGLERVSSTRGTIEYRLDLSEAEVESWFRNVAHWQPEEDRVPVVLPVADTTVCMNVEPPL